MNRERDLLKSVIYETDNYLQITTKLYEEIEQELAKPDRKGIRVKAFNCGGIEAVEVFSDDVSTNATLYLDEGVEL